MRGGLSLKRMVLISTGLTLRLHAQLCTAARHQQRSSRTAAPGYRKALRQQAGRTGSHRRPVSPGDPALLFHDGEDRQVPFVHSQRIAGHLRRSQLVRTHGLATTGLFAMRRSLRRRRDSSPTPARDSRSAFRVAVARPDVTHALPAGGLSMRVNMPAGAVQGCPAVAIRITAAMAAACWKNAHCLNYAHMRENHLLSSKYFTLFVKERREETRWRKDCGAY